MSGKKTGMDRRAFLGGSAALAATAAERPAKAGSAGETVVLAQIGCGGRGSMVCRSIAKLPNVRIAAVCDPEDARANTLQAALHTDTAHKPAVVRDLRRVLDDKSIDAVIISTPEQWHGLAAIWACQAGKDVYVEKNCSLGIWESRKMIELSVTAFWNSPRGTSEG